MQITAEAKQDSLTVYLPDTRGVSVSRFGRGNLKIGLNVYTYSRLPGMIYRQALGSRHDGPMGTCPGASQECQSICYASRPVAEGGVVYEMWLRNSITEQVPSDLPRDCTYLRLHISGDFTTAEYINGWVDAISKRPDVKVWAYTRSWRVSSLLPALEVMRALPNVQLFASMDATTPELPPIGWRRAWIDGDERADVDRLSADNRRTLDGRMSLVCPEETGRKQNCVECQYCFSGQKNDVTFLRH